MALIALSRRLNQFIIDATTNAEKMKKPALEPVNRQPDRKPNIGDVAALAGVSVGTVSNVLNSPAIVKAATRTRVEAAIAEHKAEIEAIAGSKDAPSFSNTVAAMELAGAKFDRVASVFYNLAGADTNDELQAIEREIAPVMARHGNEIVLNEKLFGRIRELYERRDELDLSPEEARLLDRYHTRFVRSGANLAPEQKKRLAEINERMAALGTQFRQNVLADEKSYMLVLEGEDDLAGLPDFLHNASAEAAKERGLEGQHVITLLRSSIEPFLQFSRRRDLRQVAWRAWISRGEHDGATDNRPIAAEMVTLRAERAKLLADILARLEPFGL